MTSRFFIFLAISSCLTVLAGSWGCTGQNPAANVAQHQAATPKASDSSEVQNESVEVIELEVLDLDPWERQFQSREHIFLRKPEELCFSCLRTWNDKEWHFGELLQSGSDDERCEAAWQLWHAHSRYYAADVLDYLPSAPLNWRVVLLRLYVEHSLSSKSVLKELESGDYLWGVWLAGLRPAPEYVPLLLTALESKKEDDLQATISALGKSHDERAFGPLLKILQSKSKESADQINAGFAAQALGHLGRLEAEAPLIAFIERGNGPFPVMHACDALAKIGSRNALPCLENLVETGRLDGGAINLGGCAQRAIQVIVAREPY
jgi:hypothetical protein